jgi:hypothetical protein
VDIEITPEPSPDERAAIEAVVAEVLAEKPATGSAWWRAGVEAADDDEPDFP